MSPESGNRFRDNDMRKNRNLKRKERIGKIAMRSRVETQLIHHVMIAAMKIAAAKFVASLSYRVA
ncbi:hypothetical protein DES43_1071, partial [Aquamicrobium defluvii]